MKDPYIISTQNPTLKNLLGITAYPELKKAETDIGYAKLLDVYSVYSEDDKNPLKTIHKHIFGDIYVWAGEYRSVPVYKQEVVIPGISLKYADVKDIKNDIEKNIKEMAQIDWLSMDIDTRAEKFTKYLAKIWRVHPFRDGNTRTTLAFANCFARAHGFEMDMSGMINALSRKTNEKGKIKSWSIRDLFVLASLDEKDCPEPQYLNGVMKKAMIAGNGNKEKQIER